MQQLRWHRIHIIFLVIGKLLALHGSVIIERVRVVTVRVVTSIIPTGRVVQIMLPFAGSRQTTHTPIATRYSTIGFDELRKVHLDDVLREVRDHEPIALLRRQLRHLDLYRAHGALDERVIAVRFVRHVDHLFRHLQPDRLLLAPHVDQLHDAALYLLDALLVAERRKDGGLLERQR
uniref:Putative secreted peptide n=1 Tax=Anopheles braziliensis TaxID=58242 RepID=A0A2M3ZTM4_9DIPT